MASEEFKKLTAYMAANPMPHIGRDEMREQMKAFGARAELPENMRQETPPDAPVPCRMFIPADAGSGLILFAHGGGFTLGSIESHAHVAAWIAQAARRRTLIFDYRLAPEHPFPAALEDYRMIYSWAIDQGDAPEQIVLAGDSAGANLSLSLVVNEGVPTPAAVVALSPSIDLAGYLELDPNAIEDATVDGRTIADGFRLYLGGVSAKDPRVSPNHGELSGVPPTFIQLGEDELFAAGALDFAKKAAAAGASVELDVWPEMSHDWHWYAPRLPEARQALERAGEFIRRRLS